MLRFAEISRNHLFRCTALLLLIVADSRRGRRELGGNDMRAGKAMMLVGGSLFAAVMAANAANAQTVSEGVTTQEAATPTGVSVQTTPASRAEDGEILVTGSRIKRDPNNSAVPLQIISNAELERNAIASPEQLISLLTSNGSGADNLASNADVTTGAQRGTNGLSAANLRGQGAAATLVLLNSRRVAAHGLSGAAVDVNQIPFAAIERVEVLKEGASAIYGTDAIGGVINFITRTDYQGVGVMGATDITEQGDGNIYRVSAIAGYGDLDEQGFNVMGAVAYRWNNILFGRDRDFVNGNQPDRGLSVDTRGTPIATAFPLNNGTYLPRGPQGQTGTLLGGTATAQLLNGLVIPGTTTAATGGINVLDLPGGAGCESMDGGMAYDDALWNNVSARYACAWDTGRAAVLQQPVKTLTYLARAVARVAEDHQISLEVTGSNANSAKLFSNAQVSSNTSNFQVAYPLNSLTAPTYNAVYNAIRGTFPAVAANYGKPIAFRWRCIACGPREYKTDTKTIRVTLAAEGPLWQGWDYRAGGSYAKSEASSVLGSGYYYRGTLNNGAYDPAAPTAPGASGAGLAGLLNSGILNPFTLNQTDAALAALAAVSAEGATLYGGRYEVKQIDYSIAGPLFTLPGGKAQLAAGVDFRSETYSFNGSAAAAASAPVIFLAAFDNVNALRRRNRQVKAAYAELLLPAFEGFELTAAARIDDYGDFGTSTNPKLSVRYRPWEPLMFRGSFSTGFRVPTFNQIFNGITDSALCGTRPCRPGALPGRHSQHDQPELYGGAAEHLDRRQSRPAAGDRQDVRRGRGVAARPQVQPVARLLGDQCRRYDPVADRTRADRQCRAVPRPVHPQPGRRVGDHRPPLDQCRRAAHPGSGTDRAGRRRRVRRQLPRRHRRYVPAQEAREADRERALWPQPDRRVQLCRRPRPQMEAQCVYQLFERGGDDRADPALSRRVPEPGAARHRGGHGDAAGLQRICEALCHL